MNSNKKIYIANIVLMILLSYFNSYADDVTATATATIGTSNSGAISLAITGGTAPYTYSWTGPGGYVNTSKNIAGLDSGEYCVSITDAYCGTTSVCARVAYSPQNVGIQEIDTKPFIVYPNPFKNELVVQSNNIWPGEIIFSLIDMGGHQVYTTKSRTADKVTILNIPSSLPGGTYTLMIKNIDKVVYSTTVVKE